MFTGYYANYDFYMQQGLTPIAISGRPPEWYKGLWWKFLAPSWDIFSKWKNKIINDDEYTDRFFKEILSKVNIDELKDQLQQIQNPILLCYEKDGFCHRHLVADWLNYHGIVCEEYK